MSKVRYRQALTGAVISASDWIKQSKQSMILFLDKHGWNSLRAAVYSQSYDTVEALLCSGVNIKSVCSAGISGTQGSYTQTLVLTQVGQKIIILLALHSAAFYDAKGNIAKLLLDYNADPNIKDKKGKIPLHVAAEVNNVKIKINQIYFLPNLDPLYSMKI